MTPPPAEVLAAEAAEAAEADAATMSTGATSPFRSIVSSPTGVAALAAVGLVLLVAVFAPVLWGDQAATFDTAALNQGPSPEHWLGTDNLGRDIGLRVLVATRLSVCLALAATLIGFVLGVTFGALTAIAGGRLARWASAAVGVAVAFPGLLLAIFFAIVFGVGKTGAVLALGIAAAPWFARLTQTLVASIAQREYVAAARAMGVGRLTILRRHLLPNVGEPLVVNAAMGAGSHLLAFAGLSFIGIGVQPPDYDWGRLLLEGVDNIYANPAGALGPGLAIVITGLAFNLTGEVGASALGGRSRRLPPLPRLPRRSTTPAVGDEPLLDVRHLTVSVPVGGRWVEAVRGVDLTLRAGDTLGLVGESGSGKSLTAMAVAGLLPPLLRSDADRLTYTGQDLVTADSRTLRRVFADSVSVVFQDPMSSLNPVIRVGDQLAEVATQHQGTSRSAARRKAVEILERVRISDPRRRARQYPHEFSGGMRQRAMIGVGLMGRPRLIIADEPTTALDVTVQREVLDVLEEARAQSGAAMVLISHDLGVIATRTHRVAVMYAGRIVEQLDAAQLRDAARHPYTRALLRSVPDMNTDRTVPLATIAGRPPRIEEMPAGCAFAARCEFASDRCRSEDPALEWSDGDAVACWHPQSGPVLRREAGR